MWKYIFYFLSLLLVLTSCNIRKHTDSSDVEEGDTLKLEYAKHLTIVKYSDFTKVEIHNPWKKHTILHTYYLSDAPIKKAVSDKENLIVLPLKRCVVFTTAHANLFEMLDAQKSIVGVTDLKYMLISDVQKRAQQADGAEGKITDCGESMKPNVEKIITLEPQAIFVSPFENSGGYGRLDKAGVPLIECAEYMETSALGRAEWMKFYGILVGKEKEADSLFNVVKTNYWKLHNLAKKSKLLRSVLPDRKVGSVWYVPGGESSVGLLYKDALGKYAYSSDKHSGSLSLPFETIVSKFGKADFWILSYVGNCNKEILLQESPDYKILKPLREGEVYGCKIDKVPYFEEVSWHPDWLLQDLIQLFHPDLKIAPLRYYKRL